MTIQIPENLARDLEGIAREQNMTIEQAALDRLLRGGRPIEQLRPVTPGCDQPDDAVALRRYMNLGRFLSMLRGGCLYFPRLREFREDSWEGVVPSALALYPIENREKLH
jgi:hypothetical protein